MSASSSTVPGLLPVLLALSAAAPPAAIARDAPLTGQEIHDAWAGRELTGSNANGARIFMRLEKDGAASVSVGTFNDTGTWRPRDDGYCTIWTQIRKGQERCFSVVRAGMGWTVLDGDGKPTATITAVR